MAKMSIELRKIDLPTEGIELLREEALAEGYRFVQRLWEEWVSGANRFSAEGEVFYGAFHGDELVAVGGLNRDPFVDSPRIGRLRKIYVRPAWRRCGVGTALVAALLQEAARHFLQVRLRTENPEAARLYERAGFESTQASDATHVLAFRLS